MKKSSTPLLGAAVSADASRVTSPDEVTADPLGGTQLAAISAERLPVGARVGEYLILGVLGEGGSSSVYGAEHQVLRRPAAIKVLRREFSVSGEMVQRFIREAQVVNTIHHPNIIDVFDLGTLSDGRPYLVMERLAGRNLRELVAQEGRLSLDRAMPILTQVCSALQAAHGAGVVHRDLKPSNVVLLDTFPQPMVKLVDFGTAKLLVTDGEEGQLTRPGQRLGTASCMAPEQVRGEAIDTRTDVYALGVLTHYLLTGRFPFESEDPFALHRMHLEVAPPRPSQLAPVSSAVDAVVMRCLAKRPPDRFADVGAVLRALTAATSGRAATRETWRTLATAIYVEFVIAEEAGDDPGVLERIGEGLNTLERELLSTAYLVPNATGLAILGARPLSLDPGRHARELSQGRELAASLEAIARLSLCDQVRLVIRTAVVEAEVRRAADGLEISGGPILDPQSWIEGVKRDPAQPSDPGPSGTSADAS